MASTGVKLGYGSTVEIGTIAAGGGGSPVITYLKLTGIDTIDFPDQQAGDVDVTHLESPGRTEESIPGLQAGADWSVDKHYIPGDDQDDLLIGLKASGEDVMLKITPAGGTATEWLAYVKGYKPTLPSKTQMMATLTLRVNAQVE